MPVMDNKFYHGRKLDDLALEMKDKGIFLSVIAPRKIPALFKLYEKAGELAIDYAKVAKFGV